MKKLILLFTFCLVITLFIAIMPTEAEGNIYHDTVRLHIIANSDNENDQELKLYIRDKLLSKYSSELVGYTSKSEAEKHLSTKLTNIKDDVEKWIFESGYNYDVEICLNTEWYETRAYDDFSLPCGYYTSLRIIIGEGVGQNWWCVLYPPMCLGAATDLDNAVLNYTDKEIHLITDGKYRIKFKLLEIISSALS